MNSDYDMLVMTSFRYCLGRRSTAPSWFVDYVTKPLHWCELSNNTKQKMLQEINECDNLGMDCDKRIWENFKQKILEDMNKE